MTRSAHPAGRTRRYLLPAVLGTAAAVAVAVALPTSPQPAPSASLTTAATRPAPTLAPATAPTTAPTTAAPPAARRSRGGVALVTGTVRHPVRSGSGTRTSRHPVSPSGTPSSGTPSSSTTAPPASTPGWWHPPVGTTWQWQLSGTLSLAPAVQAFDVDLYDTTATQVAAIHAKGAHAICYLETGAWESYRPDAASFPKAVLGRTMGGYPDERYLDIRQVSTLLPIISKRLDLCRQKGFDAVEPDIDDSVVDVGASGIGFPVTYAQQLAWNRAVAGAAHARGLAIALKNGTFGDDPDTFVNDMQPLVDFAVNEECYAAGNVCSSLSPFIAAGKAVLHTEYLDDYNASKSGASTVLGTFCPTTRALKFSSLLKDASASLSAWRSPC